MFVDLLTPQNIKALLFTACQSTFVGGVEILSVYNKAFNQLVVEFKFDNSPVTIADKNSSKAIVNYLSQIKPSFPIISEEEVIPPLKVRKDWKYFWMVDPLDGTTEFIQNSKNFGVMIALIENKSPLLGAIFFPMYDSLYFGAKGIGSFKLENCSSVFRQGVETFEQVSNLAIKLPLKNSPANYTLVQSKSHLSLADFNYFSKIKRQNKNATFIRLGSCYKFAYLVEGKANEYSRLTKVHEWDMAAGQVIIESAGGVFTAMNGKPLSYNSPKLFIDDFKAVI